MGQNKDQFKSGVLLSYLTLAISSLLPFLYTPIVLRILGQNEYGLYSLANTAIGYLSLLTFGFGSTILRYLSIYRARGEKEQEQKALGFFLLLYGAIAVLTLLGGLVIATHAETIFKRSLSAAELEKIRILLLLITANAAVTLPIGVLSSVVMAHERYLFRKMLDLGTTLLLPCANLTALFLGYASVGMAVASMIVQIALLPIYGFYCRRILRIRPIFARIPGPLLREMVGISAFVFLGAVVDMLFWSTDKLLLGMLLGTAAVAVYNIGATFNSVVMNLSGVIVNLLSPRITGLVAKDADEHELTEHFIRVGRLQFLIVALIVSGFAVFGRSFVRLWAGDEYGDAYWIAILTMFPLCIPLIENTGITILIAQNKHAFRSIVYFVIAVVNVISTILIIPYMGGIGAALCSGISYLLGQGLIMNWYYWKKIRLDIPRFWKNILGMSPVPALMLGSGLLLRRVIHVNSWVEFFGWVLLYSAVYVLGMVFLALNEEEKQLLRSAIQRLKRKKA